MKMASTKRTKGALRHLEKIKPYDGWSVHRYVDPDGISLVKLRRRNAPLADIGFREIAYDSNGTGCIVGIKSYIGETPSNTYGRGVVLVEKDGSVAKTCGRELRVALPGSRRWDYTEENREKARESMRRRNVSVLAGGNDEGGDKLSILAKYDNEALAKNGCMLIGGLAVLKAMEGLFFLVYFVALSILISYAMQTCPGDKSFDAKKELRRVLQGKYLPESHPDKPKEWFSKAMAKVGATVGAELATGLGYEVSCYVRKS